MEKSKLESVPLDEAKILKNIEASRFKTLDDPGIAGIKFRLSELDFLKVGGPCCSGHPEYLNNYDPGYIIISYIPSDVRSKNFHDDILYIETEEGNLDGRFSVPEEVYEDFSATKRGEPIRYSVEVTSRDENKSAEDVAKTIRSLWEKFSEGLNKYEKIPVREKLEDWYFAFKSNQGKIELTHDIFSNFTNEVKSRGGNIL